MKKQFKSKFLANQQYNLPSTLDLSLGSFQVGVWLICLVVFFSFFFYSGSGLAAEDVNQKILDLRKQLEELQKKSDEYKKVVSGKQKEATSLQKEISVLTNQISRLETEVRITGNKISSTQLVIGDLRDKIFDRHEKIKNRQDTVGSLLKMMYQNDRENWLAILLKNNHLSDFLDQAKQADNLNKSLLAAITVLKNERQELEENKTELEIKKQDLEKLNNSQKNQQVALSGTKSNKNNLLVRTKGQEAEYQKLLAETEKKEAEFFAELKNLEDQALQSGAFIVHVTADAVPPRGTKIFQWPEDEYHITQGYGYTAYARSRRKPYGGAPHNGIDLAGGYGTAIHPMAAGNILASGFNDGFGHWVAVRHNGGLVSVYAHLRAPSGLVNGLAVTASDVIGYEGSTGNSTGSHLHLSVYKDFFTYINEKNGQLYFNYFEGSINPLDYL
ncbi:MAG: peptidase M23 [Parcubacteria group bacterium Gr01-1014_44]|nr:MAG: peptidase M23 [Parcubacteria group bacterium Gr01-1014_44]